jgi:hypothetical protein
MSFPPHPSLVLRCFLLDMYDISLAEWFNTDTRRSMGWDFPRGFFDADIIMIQKEKKCKKRIKFSFFHGPLFGNSMDDDVAHSFVFVLHHMVSTKAFGVSRAV